MPLQCKLSEILRDKNMSQRELARRTSLRVMTINALCNNTIKQVPVEAIDAVCSELQISPSDLFEHRPE